MSCEEEASYAVDRREEPVRFNTLCDENRRYHEQRIEETHGSLIEAGVPEKYIFVVQANSNPNGSPDSGDVFPYSNKTRLEETLSSVREGAQICCSPDVFIFLCVDVRDRTVMGRYLYASYFTAKWFTSMVDSIPL